MVKKYNNLCGNTLALLLVFCISIGISYLMYSCGNKEKKSINSRNLNIKDNLNNDEDLQKKINEVNSLIINSDKVIKELEKFSDLQEINNTDNLKGDFVLDLKNNDHHKLYNEYFLKNPIKCISNSVEQQENKNQQTSEKNIIEYDNNLKSYIEAINLDLIQFLQKSYKDAHRMNIERQVDLYDIDNLPGKFM